MTMRVGLGYDIHRTTEENPLVLGGVEIPYDKGLEGWSDGDVVIHAIIDALLGAAALGDIGAHFPPGNPKYKSISSLILLQDTRRLLAEQGWEIVNIDANIIAEEPRLAPFIDKMRERVSTTLSIDIDKIGIKAKTNESMGPVGRKEAIAAQAVALLKKGK